MPTLFEKYALAVAKKYHNDPSGLLLFLGSNMELSQEKQLLAYNEMHQILKFWIQNYKTKISDNNLFNDNF